MAPDLMPRGRLIRLVAGLVGAAAVIVFGVARWSAGAAFDASAATADGVVVSVTRYPVREGYPPGGNYHPTVRFVTSDGAVVSFEDADGVEDGTTVLVGAHLPVYYDRADPDDATLRRGAASLNGIVITGFGVGVFVLIPFVALARQRAGQGRGPGERAPLTDS